MAQGSLLEPCCNYIHHSLSPSYSHPQLFFPVFPLHSTLCHSSYNHLASFHQPSLRDIWQITASITEVLTITLTLPKPQQPSELQTTSPIDSGVSWGGKSERLVCWGVDWDGIIAKKKSFPFIFGSASFFLFVMTPAKAVEYILRPLTNLFYS